MNPSQPSEILPQITDIVTKLAQDDLPIKAIGLSGSFARNLVDSYSDMDLCIFVDEKIPVPEVRKNAFNQVGLSDFIYCDIDFETSRGDGLIFNGVRCDLIWMRISEIMEYLQNLNSDFDAKEWLLGGLSSVQSLFDPEGTIDQIQSAIPKYSHSRAKHRVNNALRNVHYSLFTLKWLEKAAYRDDYFLFLKYEYETLEKLFFIWYALNHAWYSDEKRLTDRIKQFKYVPRNASDRIKAIILRKEGFSDLKTCLKNIKLLFKETAAIVNLRYPVLEIPQMWD